LVGVDDSGVLTDIDTPEIYESVLAANTRSGGTGA
jgi:hypothetical protein